MTEPQHCLYPTCPTENQLVALLQGELTEEQALAIEDAVDQCPACQELMVALAQIFAPEESPPLPSSGSALQQIHQYHLYKELGAGGMGVVYEAFDSHLQRRVALKLLRPDVFQPERREQHASRLLQEARLLAALHHPHIPVVYEVGTWEGQIFMVVQLIKGQDLRTWLRETSPGWEAILDAYLQIGRGLAAAHKAGIVHRDVKPDNIMLDRQGHAYITDFGLAFPRQPRESLMAPSASWPPPAADAALPPIQQTETGMVVGTPAYMAPEQRQGQECLPQTDQYAFCVALYESLCGIAPFPDGAPSDPQALEATLYIPSHTGIPQAIFSVLARGLRRVPIERFPSMDALVEALEDAQRTQTTKRIKPIAWAALAATLLMALGMTWWFASTNNTKTTTHPASSLGVSSPRRARPPTRQPGPMALSPHTKTALVAPPSSRRLQKTAPRPPKRRPLRRLRRQRKRRTKIKKRRRRRRRRPARPRRRRRKRRRVAMLKAAPRMKQRAAASLGALMTPYHKALGRQQGRRCMGLVQQMERIVKASPSTYSSHYLHWYKGRCLMLLGKCQRGGELIAEYYRKIGGSNIAFAKRSNQAMHCPIGRGSWQTQLERLYQQTLHAKHQRYLPLCSKLERAFTRIVRRYRAPITASFKTRHKLVASADALARCFYQKPICSKVQKLWWRGQELNKPRGLSPRERRFAEGVYQRSFPKCP